MRGDSIDDEPHPRSACICVDKMRLEGDLKSPDRKTFQSQSITVSNRSGCQQSGKRMTQFRMILLLVLVAISKAQQGLICSCTPLVYRWQLDFSLACPPSNVTYGTSSGIRDVACRIDGEGDTIVSDLTPVNVTSYEIFELNDQLGIAKKATLTDQNLTNGDRLTFSSLAATNSSVIIGGFQVRLSGCNAAGEKVELSWILKYSNLCGVNPFHEGDFLGWMVFGNLVPARPETCTLLSDAPSQVPSLSTSSPNTEPSRVSVPSAKIAPTSAPIISKPETTMSYSFSYGYGISLDFKDKESDDTRQILETMENLFPPKANNQVAPSKIHKRSEKAAAMRRRSGFVFHE